MDYLCEEFANCNLDALLRYINNKQIESNDKTLPFTLDVPEYLINRECLINRLIDGLPFIIKSESTFYYGNDYII